MKIGVVLLSGGLDSTTTATCAKSQGYKLTAITVYYGQTMSKEIESASQVAKSLGIEHKIIEKEKIEYRNFIIPEIPFLSSSGSRRAVLATVDEIEWMLNKDELNDGKQALTVKFELKKGCYATSLFREFMKSEDVRNY